MIGSWLQGGALVGPAVAGWALWPWAVAQKALAAEACPGVWPMGEVTWAVEAQVWWRAVAGAR